MINKHIGEVDASEFGGGTVIRIDMDGLARLEDQFEEFRWAQRLFIGLSMVSPNKIMAVLNVGLRNNKGTLFSSGKMPAWPSDLPLEPLARKCQDAITLFMYGKPYEQWAAEQAKKEAGGEEPENPQNGAVL